MLEYAVRNHQKERITLYVGNLLIDMAKKLCPKANTASTHGLQQWAANATDDQLKKAGIPSKYRPFLKKLGNVSNYSAKILNDC